MNNKHKFCKYSSYASEKYKSSDDPWNSTCNSESCRLLQCYCKRLWPQNTTATNYLGSFVSCAIIGGHLVNRALSSRMSARPRPLTSCSFDTPACSVETPKSKLYGSWSNAPSMQAPSGLPKLAAHSVHLEILHFLALRSCSQRFKQLIGISWPLLNAFYRQTRCPSPCDPKVIKRSNTYAQINQARQANHTGLVIILD